MEINNSSVKFNYLDSIRGIAALIVVIGHAHDSFLIPGASSIFSNFIDFVLHKTFIVGAFSVKIFFVLSGFVLSYHYFKTYNNNYLLKQSVKRVPRLFIPVLITSILYWIINHFDLFYNQEVIQITHTSWYSKLWAEKYDLITFFKRCIYDLMIFNDQSFCWNINSVLWTMPLELKFSFMLFFSVFFIRNFFSLFIHNIIISILIYYNRNFIDYLPFLLGINMAFIYTNKSIKLNVYFSFILIFIANLLANSFYLNIDILLVNQLISVLGPFIVVFTILYTKEFHHTLNNKFLVYLGKISFSLYLIHNLIIGTFSSYLYVYFYKYLNFTYSFTYNFTMLFTILVSILSAIVIYQCIDKQSLNFSNLTFTLFDKYLFSKIKNKNEFIK